MLRSILRAGARVFGAVALVALDLGASVLVAPPASAGPQLNGGGSGFAALEIDQWRADTARKPYSLNINYNATGSTDGRQNFGHGLYDFGVSDIVFTPSTEAGVLASKDRCGQPLSTCFKYVPVSAGGLAFMYNLINSSGQRVTKLQLTPDEACKIFTGAITRWNNSELVQTNQQTIPDLANLDRPIGVRVRSDGAGESYVLSQFCIAVDNPDWQRFIQAQPTSGQPDQDPDFLGDRPISNWPSTGPQPSQFAATEFADGLANAVADPVGGKDSIGYMAAGYAQVRNFPVASVLNAGGVFTQPDDLNVTVALGYATPVGDGTFNLNFSGPDPRAYFPSTYSYVLAQSAGWDPAKGAVLGQFLCYAVGQGQTIAPQLRYARLSSAVVAISVNAISQIPGAPQPNTCTAGAPAPPPPPVVLGGGGGGGGGTKSGGTGGSGGTSGSHAGATTATTAAIGGAGNGGGIGAGNSGGPSSVACSPTTSSSEVATTTAPSTTVAKATTTTAPGAASTVATTSTTVSCVDAPPAVIGSPGGSTLQSIAAGSVGGPSNEQVLSTLLEGAAICGIGIALVSWRKSGEGR